jgi:hypothetical protein
MPCCYGGEPIAPMEEYRTAWNSPVMQGIRGELLNGRFHDYCLRSTACPIVRKFDQAKALPFRQRLLLKSRESWARLDRRLGGSLNRWWRPTRASAGRAVRFVRSLRHPFEKTRLPGASTSDSTP